MCVCVPVNEHMCVHAHMFKSLVKRGLRKIINGQPQVHKRLYSLKFNFLKVLPSNPCLVLI